MEKRIVICATDSRGRGLEAFYNNTNTSPQHYCTKFIIRPGATFQILKHDILHQLNAIHLTPTSDIHILISAGICNFTEKLTHLGGTELMYNTSSDKILKIITEIENFEKEIIQAIPSHSTYKLQFTSIPPASLKNFRDFQLQRNKLYFSYFNDQDILDMQAQLNADIKSVNQVISNHNSMHHLKTLRFDRDLLKTSIKHTGIQNELTRKLTKYSFKKFYDGVHPNDYLKNKWFSMICDTLFVLDDIHSASDSDDDTWDFKR